VSCCKQVGEARHLREPMAHRSAALRSLVCRS
jgi:hypothetical protein